MCWLASPCVDISTGAVFTSKEQLVTNRLEDGNSLLFVVRCDTSGREFLVCILVRIVRTA